MSYLVKKGLMMQGAAASTLLNGIISYWKLDEASGNAVDSHASNDIVMSGGITYSKSGIVGTAFEFNGSTGKGDFNGTTVSGTPCSVSLWVNITDVPATKRIFTLIVNGAANDILSIYEYAFGGQARIAVQHWDGSQAIATNSTNLKDVGWVHIVALWESDSLRRVYINNSLEGSDTTAQSSVTCNYLQLGYIDLAGSDIQFFSDDIDEIGIWNRVLTTDEITELYNGGAGLSYPF